MTISHYSIGLSLGSLVNLEQFAVPIIPPKSTYTPGGRLLSLGDFSTRWVGFPRATWSWDILRRHQRDSLRLICPEPLSSRVVVFTTRVNDFSDEFRTFSGTMIWPPESKDFGYRPGFSVQFVGLVELEDYGSP